MWRLWKRIAFREVDSLKDILTLEDSHIVIPRAKELVELDNKVYEVVTIKHFPQTKHIVVLLKNIR